MVRNLLCLSLCLASGLATAQGTVPDRRVGPLPPERDPQRREEIREVLKSHRNASAPAPGAPVPGADPVLRLSPTYQLSPAGRAELREQLRREQRENRGMRP